MARSATWWSCFDQILAMDVWHSRPGLWIFTLNCAIAASKIPCFSECYKKKDDVFLSNKQLWWSRNKSIGSQRGGRSFSTVLLWYKVLIPMTPDVQFRCGELDIVIYVQKSWLDGFWLKWTLDVCTVYRYITWGQHRLRRRKTICLNVHFATCIENTWEVTEVGVKYGHLEFTLWDSCVLIFRLLMKFVFCCCK